MESQLILHLNFLCLYGKLSINESGRDYTRGRVCVGRGRHLQTTVPNALINGDNR